MKIKRKLNWIIPLGLVTIVLLSLLIPRVRESIIYRVDNLYTRIYYRLNPPEEAVFLPNTPLPGTTEAAPDTPTPSPQPTLTPSPEVIQDTATPTPTATPLPTLVALEGVPYIDQHGLYNYCAPSNLAMALGYWGWTGSRTDIGPVVKPFEEDFNVMPYELANYVDNYTDLSVIVRSGGTLELLKTLLASGFPVLIEKGAYIRDLSGRVTWMGHYNVFSGYDDTKGEMIVQDSYYMANYRISYEQIIREWRGFNYVFMVVYPADQQERLFTLLGDYVDEAASYQIAYNIATYEVYALEGVDQYMAWFNRGTSMVNLLDYYGAAESYDQAFLLYAALAEDERPFRMVWYQTGPYAAYYYTGRYQEVIDLATTTLDTARKPYLEESFVWRARAEQALGDSQTAIADFCTSLQYHPDFPPSLDGLSALGMTPADCP